GPRVRGVHGEGDRLTGPGVVGAEDGDHRFEQVQRGMGGPVDGQRPAGVVGRGRLGAAAYGEGEHGQVGVGAGAYVGWDVTVHGHDGGTGRGGLRVVAPHDPV